MPIVSSQTLHLDVSLACQADHNPQRAINHWPTSREQAATLSSAHSESKGQPCSV